MQESNRKPIELASSELSVISTQTKENQVYGMAESTLRRQECVVYLVVQRMYVQELCDPCRRGQKEAVNS